MFSDEVRSVVHAGELLTSYEPHSVLEITQISTANFCSGDEETRTTAQFGGNI